MNVHEMISSSLDSEQDTQSPAWGWREVGIVIGLVAGAMILILAIFRGLRAVTGQEAALGATSPATYAAMTLIYLVMVVCIYLFTVRRAGWSALGVRFPAWQTLALTPLLLFVTLAGIVLINSTIARVSGNAFENPQVAALTGGKPLSLPVLVLLLVLVAGLVPIAEELLFRGMIYPLLRYRWGRGVAIVGSALIFAVAHMLLLLMPALFFVGLVLGLLREWSKSVIPGMVLHAMQNGLALILINMVLSQ